MNLYLSNNGLENSVFGLKSQVLNSKTILKSLKLISIVSLISSVLLFILTDEIKYLIFTITVPIILTTIIFSSNKNIYIHIRNSMFQRIADYFFILASYVVLANTFTSIFPSHLILIFTTTLLYFLPGWLFLRILGYESKHGPLYSVVFSFVLSIGISTLVSLLFSQLGNFDYMPFLFFILSLILLAVRWKKFDICSEKKVSYDLVSLVFIALLVLPVSSIIYFAQSDIAQVLGMDVTRHFRWAHLIVVSPAIYGGGVSLVSSIMGHFNSNLI